jgi:hypothetical protein
MMIIPLTQNMVAYIDDEDYTSINSFKWYARKHGNTFYALRSVKTCKGGITLYMHRIINKTPDGVGTDHIDGNGLNNQKSNLRTATHQQNGENLHVDKTSKFPGVSLSDTKKKWLVRVRVNGIQKVIGYYSIEEEAATVYMVAKKCLL